MEDWESDGDDGRGFLGWVSLVCGFLSIACFIFVQAPQIVKNIIQV